MPTSRKAPPDCSRGKNPNWPVAEHTISDRPADLMQGVLVQTVSHLRFLTFAGHTEGGVFDLAITSAWSCTR
jgi:hypothetical protein